MTPEDIERFVQGNQFSTENLCSISMNAQENIIHILRNKLYSNKLLAVCREYICNALDEHRDALQDREVRVGLPCETDPYLSIRDYGRGLSPEDIANVYLTYGASTKRDAEDLTGQYGIGSKAGFCYTDTFLITSYWNGSKSTYVATTRIFNTGSAPCVSSEFTTESGIEIRIPIQEKDWEKCITIAKEFLKWTIAPAEVYCGTEQIAIERPDIYAEFPGWCLRKTKGSPLQIRLGNVVYDVDRTQTNWNSGTSSYRIASPEAYAQVEFRMSAKGLDITASRESLEYTEACKEILNKRISLWLYNAYNEIKQYMLEVLDKKPIARYRLVMTLEDLGNVNLNQITNRLRTEFLLLSRKHILHISEAVEDKISVTLQLAGHTSLSNIRDEPIFIDTTRIIINDVRGLSEQTHKLGSHSHIFLRKRRQETTEEEFQSLIQQFMIDNRIEDMPIATASSLGLINLRIPKERVIPKAANTFLLDIAKYRSPYSQAWTEAEVPSGSIVVQIDRFESPEIEHYKAISQWMEVKPLYGYKKDITGNYLSLNDYIEELSPILIEKLDLDIKHIHISELNLPQYLYDKFLEFPDDHICHQIAVLYNATRDIRYEQTRFLFARRFAPTHKVECVEMFKMQYPLLTYIHFYRSTSETLDAVLDYIRGMDVFRTSTCT